MAGGPLDPAAAPLAGTTVVDLSWHLAGPFCAMTLADLGARVIKVEPPGSKGGYDPGGIIRHLYAGDDLHYIAVNRSKESLTLDLKDEVGLADFYRLVERADVVFNNFRPGVVDRLRIDFDTLRQYNERLVYASLSAFGSTGPDQARPGVDLVIQAMSGGMSMTGYPGERPARAGIPVADLAGGMWTALAIVSALLRRADGYPDAQYVDMSLLDGQMALIPYFAAYYLNGGFLAGPQGSGGHSPTYGAFAGQDGRYFVVAVIDQAPWTTLCHALGREDWLADPRFASAAERIDHTEELSQLLAEHFSTAPARKWVDVLQEAGIPCGPVNNLAEALDERQVRARDMIVDVPHRSGGQVQLVGTPIRLTGFTPAYGAPPRPGGDSDRLREEFGLSWRPRAADE
ncbi:CaiB/BaiF CoA transferase family protein [Actinophytocola sp.]|uniref:CaiB/BaiF CoA transferase family protein n=1 Tax=Actinophytocola sp. TaxID=1872138 RepID=UPI003D6AE634